MVGRQFFRSGLATIALVTLVAADGPDRWIAVSHDKGTTILIDTQTVKLDRNTVTAWFKYLYPPENDGTSMMITKTLVNCDSMTFTNQSIATYTPTGVLKFSQTIKPYEQEDNDIIPSSSGDIVFGTICDKLIEWRSK